jgi:hypothetical protein
MRDFLTKEGYVFTMSTIPRDGVTLEDVAKK